MSQIGITTLKEAMTSWPFNRQLCLELRITLESEDFRAIDGIALRTFGHLWALPMCKRPYFEGSQVTLSLHGLSGLYILGFWDHIKSFSLDSLETLEIIKRIRNNSILLKDIIDASMILSSLNLAFGYVFLVFFHVEIETHTQIISATR